MFGGIESSSPLNPNILLGPGLPFKENNFHPLEGPAPLISDTEAPKYTAGAHSISQQPSLERQMSDISSQPSLGMSGILDTSHKLSSNTSLSTPLTTENYSISPYNNISDKLISTISDGVTSMPIVPKEEEIIEKAKLEADLLFHEIMLETRNQIRLSILLFRFKIWVKFVDIKKVKRERKKLLREKNMRDLQCFQYYTPGVILPPIQPKIEGLPLTLHDLLGFWVRKYSEGTKSYLKMSISMDLSNDIVNIFNDWVLRYISQEVMNISKLNSDMSTILIKENIKFPSLTPTSPPDTYLLSIAINIYFQLNVNNKPIHNKYAKFIGTNFLLFLGTQDVERDAHRFSHMMNHAAPQSRLSLLLLYPPLDVWGITLQSIADTLSLGVWVESGHVGNYEIEILPLPVYTKNTTQLYTLKTRERTIYADSLVQAMGVALEHTKIGLNITYITVYEFIAQNPLCIWVHKLTDVYYEKGVIGGELGLIGKLLEGTAYSINYWVAVYNHIIDMILKAFRLGIHEMGMIMPEFISLERNIYLYIYIYILYI